MRCRRGGHRRSRARRCGRVRRNQSPATLGSASQSSDPAYRGTPCPHSLRPSRGTTHSSSPSVDTRTTGEARRVARVPPLSMTAALVVELQDRALAVGVQQVVLSGRDRRRDVGVRRAVPGVEPCEDDLTSAGSTHVAAASSSTFMARAWHGRPRRASRLPHAGTSEVPGEEPDRAVGLEPGQLLVPARVGVQRLLLRGEGVEQRETLLARDVLVVPLQRRTRSGW